MVSHPQTSSTLASSSTDSKVSSEAPQTLKLLLIGSSSVGKSSLLLRFADEGFLPPEESSATIGVDFKVKMMFRRGKRYRITIWDTAGQERFRTLTSSYYRGAQGVLLVYDVTDRESFEALPSWSSELDTFTHAPADVVRVIVGNKVDKRDLRVVSSEEGRAFAEDNKALFFETSVKTKMGVEEVFKAVVDKIIDTPALHRAKDSRGLNQHRGMRSIPGAINLEDYGRLEDESSWCAC
ncbi:GTP-binding protein yptV3 [Phakopsora pachyrhizi]|uniref:GTP-binding protein yptV3 n=1 Tax=Phakopsora pachyrhizi TaxID=170000 RepID=A0AAV0AWU5_PHAPC|nr:GTP-binding protein yptV3 [Phakopsora pachyrhizi]KAI8451016.1 GTP-binding protein yptV3 [Phakopsora pachyrhizi]CAH7673757.1 GTP-binding protein yptV3 [Phakopsora pachyrhizi]